MERDERPVKKAPRENHFNSHAHVERDGGATWIGHGVYISTHTLTWSVTSVILIYVSYD